MRRWNESKRKMNVGKNGMNARYSIERLRRKGMRRRKNTFIMSAWMRIKREVKRRRNKRETKKRKRVIMRISISLGKWMKCREMIRERSSLNMD